MTRIAKSHDPRVQARDAIQRVTRRAWVTPEPLNVAPQLVGLALARPGRRALAMGLDLAVVGLLTSVSGMWLLAGLALVVLQLRSRGTAASSKKGSGSRAVMGWLAAGLVLLLAIQEAGSQWDAWRHPEKAVRAEAAEGAAEVAETLAAASEAAAEAAAGLSDAAAEGRAASAPAVVVAALEAAATAASSAAVPGSAPASAAAAAVLSDRQRIAKLEAQLAQARKPKTLKQQLLDFIDDIGAGLGWGIVYFSLLPAWWNGQTVGKKFFGLRVMELTGKPMTVMRNLKRYGGYAAGLATGGVGFAQVLWDPNRQGLHDKAAHTVVVDLRGSRREADIPPVQRLEEPPEQPPP